MEMCCFSECYTTSSQPYVKTLGSTFDEGADLASSRRDNCNAFRNFRVASKARGIGCRHDLRTTNSEAVQLRG
jgi:hypothetical protein